jgi:hypothetical protein
MPIDIGSSAGRIRILRILVPIDVCLVLVLFYTTEFFEPAHAPQELRQYLSGVYDDDFPGRFAYAVAYPAILIEVVSLVGLLLLWRWARMAYTIFYCILIILLSMVGIIFLFLPSSDMMWTASSIVGFALTSISLVVSGSILTLVWLMKDEFAASKAIPSTSSPSS